MSTPLSLTRDINGYNTFGISFGVDNYQTVLAANVAQSVTVPDNYATWLAVFFYLPGATVWVANNDTAEVPSGSFALTNSQGNPSARQVNAGDVLSFISGVNATQVGVAFYAIN